ncbi:Pre-rRNA-processing protein TSR2-domain-containing protein [Achaetomium macrosporum]|uniref:Pre-rRNA-processing protein TSR2-domain-containing protein n=1 Tax=Achaetomium macrosporum TaxID=79813 RepID=A0AAN7HB89_9PEZI|nr:Pre-rRNA-processing protein TSR2-domain-containing protein [Achaetomium macrosporum]
MTSTTPPSPATCQETFEQGVALALHLWPALTLAVQNNWGGPESSDKRDWFAGVIVELFPDVSKFTPAQLQQRIQWQQLQLPQQQQQNPSAQNGAGGSGTNEEPDQEDVEERLLQVMLDEFEVNVDDDSAWDVAGQVVQLRGECLRGKFEGVEALRKRWESRKGSKVVIAQADDQDGETDWDTDDDDREGDEEGDVEMDEAPALPEAPARKQREEPEVDEDGFTKVTRKKR